MGLDERYIKELDAVAARQLKDGIAKGIAVRIIKEGQRIYEALLGFADEENKLPVRRDTIYRIYSMTKPITAAALMILIERGRVSLEDKVSRYFNSFKEQMVESPDGLQPALREVTVYDLLTMTSGLVYPDIATPAGARMQGLFDEFYKKAASGSAYSTEEMCSLIGNIPLGCQPGTLWNYGTSADIIGGIIEKVSGKRFGQFLKDEIFSPLGMKDTDFYVPCEKRERFAQMYERTGEGALKVCDWQHLGMAYNYAKAPEFEVGGAGLVSTMDDYERFAGMLMGMGEYKGKRIISPQSVKYLTEGHLTKKQRESFNWDSCIGYTYGGLMRVLDNEDAALVGTQGEYGWDGWGGTYFCNDPKNKLIFMYMIQVCEGGVNAGPVRELRKVLYKALKE